MKMAVGTKPAEQPRKAVDTWQQFQRSTSQLFASMLPTFHGGKVRWFTGEKPKRGAGAPLRKQPYRELDWSAWRKITYDLENNQKPIFIDVEPTRQKENPLDYVTNKVVILEEVSLFNKGLAAACSNPAKDYKREDRDPRDLPESDPEAFLFFVSDAWETLPPADEIQARLNGLPGPGKFTCHTVTSAYPGAPVAIAVKTPSELIIHIGLLAHNKKLELVKLARALTQSKRQLEHDERFLFELTVLAGSPRFLAEIPQSVEVLNATSAEPNNVGTKTVQFVKFSIRPENFLRLATVLRLVSDFSFLQRLPIIPHLNSMAEYVQRRERFPTPLLCILPKGTIIQSPTPGQWRLQMDSSRFIKPYSTQIVDGQHRAFCYYLAPGGNLRDIDINGYVLTDEADRAAVASSLFLNVNYLPAIPPIDLALIHFAHATTWPNKWIGARRGSGYAEGAIVQSPRALAARFLYELSQPRRLFEGFFRVRGVQEDEETPISSLTTYMIDDFDILDPSDKNNPIAQVYGLVPGAEHVLWRVKEPTPADLLALWPELVNQFENFVKATVGYTNESATGRLDDLKAWSSDNINVFVGLWKCYYWARFGRPTPRTRKGLPALAPRWPVAPDATARLMTRLDNLQKEGRLSRRLAKGVVPTGERYATGRGARTLPLDLYAAMFQERD